MSRKVIAFDLDDTLSVTKSPISDRMSGLLGKLVELYDICVISGGKFEQFERQVIDRLDVPKHVLNRFHMMPTCGTRYYRYDELADIWRMQYHEDLSSDQKVRITDVLTKGAKELGLWVEKPAGEIIEDRGSQLTFSALGQQATPTAKYAWDPDSKKRMALRDFAAPLLPDVEVRVGGTTSVDVTKIGVDKAYGMEKLIQVLEIGKDDILFIGDKLEEGGNDYPVKAMGIDTIAVDGWKETALVIEGILAVS